ncbi:MAG: hypothetical protein IT281_10625 [Ignavibacteria bacterium]|nr:hypothetical protein [Ignavibacteria bacterium]
MREAVSAAQSIFLNSTLITSQIVDQEEFELDTFAVIQQFQQDLPSNFLQQLQMVRGLNQANGLISVYSTNWRPLPLSEDVNNDVSMIFFETQQYGQCNCATKATCAQYLGSSIPGYVVGCVPLEALLQSTIECHYNMSCIESLYSYSMGEYSCRTNFI